MWSKQQLLCSSYQITTKWLLPYDQEKSFLTSRKKLELLKSNTREDKWGMAYNYPWNSRYLKDDEADRGDKKPFRHQNIAIAVNEAVKYETVSAIAKCPVSWGRDTEESQQHNCITEA